MELRKLGDSDLKITPVGLGTWAIGGEGGFSWGPQDDVDSIATILEAVEQGINWIDTAAIYGLGHAETIVARAMKQISGDKKPYIFTKCSLVWDDQRKVSHNLEPGSLRREVELSLKRLEVDTIDLYQVHWPSFPPGTPAEGIEEAWSTMADLKKQGKVRYIGVSNFNADEMERVRKIASITSLQPPYSMLMRQVEESVLPYCAEHNIGVIVYSPMHNGLLTGKYDRAAIERLPDSDWRKQANPAFKEPHLSRNLEVVDLLSDIGNRHDRSVADVAVAWTLQHPTVTAAIVGARRPGQIAGFIGAMKYRLSESEFAEIAAKLPESIGLFA